MSSSSYPPSGGQSPALTPPSGPGSTPASPQLVTAAGGVIPVNSIQRQILFVAGNGGPVVVTAVPQIAASTVFGAELILIGSDATNTVTLDSSTGVSLNGQVVLAAGGTGGSPGSSVYLVWNGTAWVEISRR